MSWRRANKASTINLNALPEEPVTQVRRKAKLRSVGTELVPFAGGAITVHELNSGERVASIWILARAVGIEPVVARAGVELLPHQLRARLVTFLRDGAAVLGLPLQALADLAALPADVVPEGIRPIWEAARA